MLRSVSEAREHERARLPVDRYDDRFMFLVTQRCRIGTNITCDFNTRCRVAWCRLKGVCMKKFHWIIAVALCGTGANQAMGIEDYFKMPIRIRAGLIRPS
jgi:hypothetical protein